jgi:hypothetical protein
MIKDHDHIRLVDLEPGHKLTPGSRRQKALEIIKHGANSNGVYPIAHFKLACRPAFGRGGSDKQAMNALEGLCRLGYPQRLERSKILLSRVVRRPLIEPSGPD